MATERACLMVWDGLRPDAGIARELEPADLRWACEPASLERAVAAAGKEARREREPRATRTRSALPVAAREIVGQERALAAIRAGLAHDGPGFNVFVCGPEGFVAGIVDLVKRLGVPDEAIHHEAFAL